MRNGMKLYKLLRVLEREPKRLKKKDILKNEGTLAKLMFYYAYNPFLRYHIRRIPRSLKGKGSQDLGMPTWELLTSLARRNVVGTSARRQLFTYIESLDRESGEVVKRIVGKNLSCGVKAILVNSVWEGLIPEHRIMRAYEYHSDRLPDSFSISPKVDGIRALFKNGELFFRSGHVAVGMDHITSRLDPSKVYDGELSVPGVDFNRASGIIRSYEPTKYKVVYGMFDNLTDPSLPHWERYKNLPKPNGVCQHIPHIPIRFPDDPVKVVGKYYTNARAQGYEGVMIKNLYSPYEFKKSIHWLKLKPSVDEEFTITGVYEGEGKYEGMLGGITIRTGKVTTNVGGGFSDWQREVWWQRPAKIIGKKATIKFMERQPSGKLRHPEFKTVRWDV